MNIKDPWTPTFQTQRGISWGAVLAIAAGGVLIVFLVMGWI